MKHLIISYIVIVILAFTSIYYYEKKVKRERVIESPKINLTESIDPSKKITLRRMNCPDYKCENWVDE